MSTENDTEAAVAALVEEYTQLGLVKQCEERGIAKGGNKKELATRIVEYDEQTKDETLNRTDAAAYADAETIPEREQPAAQPYSFRDIEEGIEVFSAGSTQDIHRWLKHFEEISTMAGWSAEQKLIMCRKKLTGVARSFLGTLVGMTTFQKLRQALINEFGRKMRASDVHRLLSTRRKKKEESALEFVYSMQELANQIKLDEASLIEYIADGFTEDENQRALFYASQNIAMLKEALFI